MFRKFLLAVGLVEILTPEEFLESAERFALENPEECARKSWVVPFARAEGLFFLWLAWRGGDSVSTFKTSLGIVGLVALLYPRVFVDQAAEFAYADAERCRWKAWCYPVTRLVGILYIIVALDELRNR